MTDIASGNAALDRYLADGYERVPGMSSRFAAAICGHLIRRQIGLGVRGDVAEIGAFEGRFFIAMALGLAPGEVAVAIDPFTWPDEQVLDRFLANCAAHGLDCARIEAWKVRSHAVAPAALRQKLATGALRFIHIDGDHRDEDLAADLELAHAVLHPDGLIAVDDMLHPGYPTLVTVVFDYLARHSEMAVMCIVDRVDISAAAKFLICRAEAIALYQGDLMERFARFHFAPGGKVNGHLALVLTTQGREIDLG
jgi:predicted O-methyltransferase YrrM